MCLQQREGKGFGIFPSLHGLSILSVSCFLTAADYYGVCFAEWAVLTDHAGGDAENQEG